MQWLIDKFSKNPLLPALIHHDVVYTYADLVNLIDTHQARIINNGIKSGSIVCVCGDYSPEVVCLLLALFKLDIVAVPITKISVVEIDKALSVSGCDFIIEHNHCMDFSYIDKSVPCVSDLMNEFKSELAAGIVLFSSGSTGKPKGILHRFSTVLEKFTVQRAPLVTISFLMIDHFGGINTILGVLSNLGTIVTVADRSVDSVCNAIEKHHVELLPTTPSFLNLLLASKAYEKYDLSSLNKISYGTEVMPEGVLTKLIEIFPNVKFQQTYGLSEVGVLNSVSRPDGSLWVKLGGSGFETKVVDGTLWVRSKYKMVGYLNADSKFDAEGWFDTQDKVEVDGEYFKILGRVTDLINVGGQKVYPVEVEDVILQHPNVLDVAIYGEPHPLLGQVVSAKLNLKNAESSDSIKSEIRSFCKDKLANYKIPVKVHVTEDVLHNSRQKKLRKQ